VCRNDLRLPYPAFLPTTRLQIEEAVSKFSSGYSGAAQVLFDAAPTSGGESGHAGAPGVPADPRDADFAEHDRYFQVTRVADRPIETFLRSLVLAHSSVYEDAVTMGVTTLDDREWQRLFLGLNAILQYAAGQPAKEPEPVQVRSVPVHLSDGYDPERRWLVGHQLFFAIVQGAIVGLNCYAAAADGGDEWDASVAMGVASAFMRSSAVAIKFCGDFGPVDYQDRIRPAMAPPAVQAGFSGLQTRDHAFLVGLFGRLRSSGRPNRDGPIREAFEDFVDATVSAYEAHQYVCARFGGDVLPSLRMAAASGGRTTQSGVAALRLIMRRRLFSLTDDEVWNRGGGT